VPHGEVIGTDLSEEMLKVADENANRKAISNFSTLVCDTAEMPFDNNSFDVVVCRHGFMFFPDMDMALREMIRVLRPGGSLVASVWNIPDRNTWICDSMKTMVTMLNLNPPSPGAPGIFRCTTPGMMLQLLETGGLKNIEETIVPGFLPCESFDQYWEFITEVASPVAFRNADDEMKQRIRQELHQKVMDRQQDGHLMLEASSIVISGIKA
jgi:SAM-dependent methyltransferase